MTDAQNVVPEPGSTVSSPEAKIRPSEPCSTRCASAGSRTVPSPSSSPATTTALPTPVTLLHTPLIWRAP